jgi:hypothetical protein
VQHEELESVSIDATMRCTFPVMGQAPHLAAELSVVQLATRAGRTTYRHARAGLHLHMQAANRQTFSFPAGRRSDVE